MKYSIKVNEVRAKEGSNIKGFATVVFGDSFKITNIAILENKDKGELFVSMPRYRSNERDESLSTRMSAIRSQRISGKNSIMRLSLNMRKQRIRATKRRGRVPRNIMAIPIKRRTKRQRPFDNQ